MAKKKKVVQIELKFNNIDELKSYPNIYKEISEFLVNESDEIEIFDKFEQIWDNFNYLETKEDSSGFIMIDTENLLFYVEGNNHPYGIEYNDYLIVVIEDEKTKEFLFEKI